jgi:hypothetical protein
MVMAAPALPTRFDRNGFVGTARILAGTTPRHSLFTAGCGFPSGRPCPDDPATTLQSWSGVVTDGDVQTSSLSVTWTAATPDFPGLQRRP